MKTAVFIGRFQPFHLGHYSVLMDLVRQGFEQIIIGIGSAQYRRTRQNPLSAMERRRCIVATVQQRPVLAKLSLVDLPDIHNDAAWVAHVERILYTVTTQYDTVVSSNPLVQRLFHEAGRVVQPALQTIAISGSQLRQWIWERNPEWRRFVNPRVANWIEPIIINSHGPNRTQNSDSATRH